VPMERKAAVGLASASNESQLSYRCRGRGMLGVKADS